jgi:hypothetical protein
MDFQSMVAAFRDVDRYRDRISKSEAIFRLERKIALLVMIRPRRGSRVRESMAPKTNVT